MTFAPGYDDFIELGALDLSQYECAVILYWAPWSGPAKAAFDLLYRKMQENPVPIKVLFVSSDSASTKGKGDSLIKIFGAIPHGYGEVCWVLRGNIVAQDVLRARKPAETVNDSHSLVEQRLRRMSLD